MKARLDIKEFEDILVYDRFSVHTYGKSLKEQVNELRKKLELDTDQNEVVLEYKHYYRQIGIYFAFYDRNKRIAELFLKKFSDCCTSNLERAEALSLLGYIKTIDPTFKDESVFEETLTLLLKEDVNENQIKIVQSFVLQYKALMFHRQAIDTTNQLNEMIKKLGTFDTGSVQAQGIEHANQLKDLEVKLANIEKQALTAITEAINIQRDILKNSPYLNVEIGLAESLHISSVMDFRQGNFHKNKGEKDLSEKKFEAAISGYKEAIKLEEIFCKKTGALHFLLATTNQSYGLALAEVGEYATALTLLQTALNIQLSIFATEVHEDVAKTKAFIGMVYFKKGDYILAVQENISTLVLKMQINYENDKIIRFTHNDLKESLNKAVKQLPAGDYQKAMIYYEQVYDTLEAWEKKGIFCEKNKPINEEFKKFLTKTINDFRDKISVEANKPGSPNRFPYTPVVQPNAPVSQTEEHQRQVTFNSNK